MPNPKVPLPNPTVAIFDASEDTVDMLRELLEIQGYQAIGGHLDDLKKGATDLLEFMDKHNPQVLIIDIAPPYDKNWAFFRMLNDTVALRERQVVLTTTNKARLDEIVGEDSGALEIVGKPYDLNAIVQAVKRAMDQ
jgi:DNA-binding NtrC family response regulator